MFEGLVNSFKGILPRRLPLPLRSNKNAQKFHPALEPIDFNDFLGIELPVRGMLLDPILPERSLAMLYAPRGIGKTMLSLSIGLAVASGSPLLRWSAPQKRRVFT
jgi:hypothetical protein